MGGGMKNTFKLFKGRNKASNNNRSRTSSPINHHQEEAASTQQTASTAASVSSSSANNSPVEQQVTAASAAAAAARPGTAVAVVNNKADNLYEELVRYQEEFGDSGHNMKGVPSRSAALVMADSSAAPTAAAQRPTGGLRQHQADSSTSSFSRVTPSNSAAAANPTSLLLQHQKSNSGSISSFLHRHQRPSASRLTSTSASDENTSVSTTGDTTTTQNSTTSNATATTSNTNYEGARNSLLLRPSALNQQTESSSLISSNVATAAASKNFEGTRNSLLLRPSSAQNEETESSSVKSDTTNTSSTARNQEGPPLNKLLLNPQRPPLESPASQTSSASTKTQNHRPGTTSYEMPRSLLLQPKIQKAASSDDGNASDGASSATSRDCGGGRNSLLLRKGTASGDGSSTMRNSLLLSGPKGTSSGGEGGSTAAASKDSSNIGLRNSLLLKQQAKAENRNSTAASAMSSNAARMSGISNSNLPEAADSANHKEATEKKTSNSSLLLSGSTSPVRHLHNNSARRINQQRIPQQKESVDMISSVAMPLDPFSFGASMPLEPTKDAVSPVPRKGKVKGASFIARKRTNSQSSTAAAALPLHNPLTHSPTRRRDASSPTPGEMTDSPSAAESTTPIAKPKLRLAFLRQRSSSALITQQNQKDQLNKSVSNFDDVPSPKQPAAVSPIKYAQRSGAHSSKSSLFGSRSPSITGLSAADLLASDSASVDGEGVKAPDIGDDISDSKGDALTTSINEESNRKTLAVTPLPTIESPGAREAESPARVRKKRVPRPGRGGPSLLERATSFRKPKNQVSLVSDDAEDDSKAKAPSTDLSATSIQERSEDFSSLAPPRLASEMGGAPSASLPGTSARIVKEPLPSSSQSAELSPLAQRTEAKLLLENKEEAVVGASTATLTPSRSRRSSEDHTPATGRVSPKREDIASLAPPRLEMDDAYGSGMPPAPSVPAMNGEVKTDEGEGPLEKDEMAALLSTCFQLQDGDESSSKPPPNEGESAASRRQSKRRSTVKRRSIMRRRSFERHPNEEVSSSFAANVAPHMDMDDAYSATSAITKAGSSVKDESMTSTTLAAAAAVAAEQADIASPAPSEQKIDGKQRKRRTLLQRATSFRSRGNKKGGLDSSEDDPLGDRGLTPTLLGEMYDAYNTSAPTPQTALEPLPETSHHNAEANLNSVNAERSPVPPHAKQERGSRSTTPTPRRSRRNTEDSGDVGRNELSDSLAPPRLEMDDLYKSTSRDEIVGHTAIPRLDMTGRLGTETTKKDSDVNDSTGMRKLEARPPMSAQEQQMLKQEMPPVRQDDNYSSSQPQTEDSYRDRRTGGSRSCDSSLESDTGPVSSRRDVAGRCSDTDDEEVGVMTGFDSDGPTEVTQRQQQQSPKPGDRDGADGGEADARPAGSTSGIVSEITFVTEHSDVRGAERRAVTTPPNGDTISWRRTYTSARVESSSEITISPRGPLRDVDGRDLEEYSASVAPADAMEIPRTNDGAEREVYMGRGESSARREVRSGSSRVDYNKRKVEMSERNRRILERHKRSSIDFTKPSLGAGAANNESRFQRRDSADGADSIDSGVASRRFSGDGMGDDYSVRRRREEESKQEIHVDERDRSRSPQPMQVSGRSFDSADGVKPRVVNLSERNRRILERHKSNRSTSRDSEGSAGRSPEEHDNLQRDHVDRLNRWVDDEGSPGRSPLLLRRNQSFDADEVYARKLQEEFNRENETTETEPPPVDTSQLESDHELAERLAAMDMKGSFQQHQSEGGKQSAMSSDVNREDPTTVEEQLRILNQIQREQERQQQQQHQPLNDQRPALSMQPRDFSGPATHSVPPPLSSRSYHGSSPVPRRPMWDGNNSTNNFNYGNAGFRGPSPPPPTPSTHQSMAPHQQRLQEEAYARQFGNRSRSPPPLSMSQFRPPMPTPMQMMPQSYPPPQPQRYQAPPPQMQPQYDQYRQLPPTTNSFERRSPVPFGGHYPGAMSGAGPGPGWSGGPGGPPPPLPRARHPLAAYEQQALEQRVAGVFVPQDPRELSMRSPAGYHEPPPPSSYYPAPSRFGGGPGSRGGSNDWNSSQHCSNSGYGYGSGSGDGPPPPRSVQQDHHPYMRQSTPPPRYDSGPPAGRYDNGPPSVGGGPGPMSSLGRQSPQLSVSRYDCGPPSGRYDNDPPRSVGGGGRYDNGPASVGGGPGPMSGRESPQIVECQGCRGRLQAPLNYDLVYCPTCGSVTPVGGGPGPGGGDGHPHPGGGGGGDGSYRSRSPSIGSTTTVTTTASNPIRRGPPPPRQQFRGGPLTSGYGSGGGGGGGYY